MNIDLDAVGKVALAAGKAGAPFIEQVLLGVATAETGPIGPIVLNLLFPMINKALGIAEDSTPDETAAKIESDPDAGQKLDTLAEDHQFQLALEKQTQDYNLQSQAQQVAISTEEIQNPSMFIAGWRPLVGWGLGGILLVSVTLPFVVWFITASFGITLPPAPVMDSNALYMLSGLLGITIAARSVDKATGTAASSIGGVTTKTKVIK